MKKTALCLALVGLLALGGSAFAEIGTIDDVPAATLLLPYFECELGANLAPAPGGVTTLFSINNASATAVLAHVTFWTDESIPTLDFDIYLTGYDVQTINVFDIFNGILPRTADAGVDTGDTTNPNDGISNQGALSQDINFPGATGPCGSAATVYAAPPAPTLTPALIDHIRKAHTGRFSPVYGGCVGLAYGDNIARGYVTVDSVLDCTLLTPCDIGYFADDPGNTSQIGFYLPAFWGDWYMVDYANDFAHARRALWRARSCHRSP